ncbi:MAG: hypothetical protein WA691_09460 [Thermoplasmata archaeon]
MTEPAETFRSPYTHSPGSSTPGPEVTPAEARADFWTFFWVAIASIVIITVGGLSAWLWLHH